MKGVEIRILVSKTDQAGEGQVVFVAAMEEEDPRRDKECPVSLLQGLHARRREEQTYVFAQVRARYRPTAISADTARSRLKSYLATFLPAEQVKRLSTHSLRKGGATEAAHLGVPMPLIKVQGRWRSDAVYAYALTSDKEVLRLTQTLLRATIG